MLLKDPVGKVLYQAVVSGPQVLIMNPMGGLVQILNTNQLGGIEMFHGLPGVEV
jgi:hypothetical protein